MYGSGIFNKRAKIYKRVQENQEWKEVYTEPAEGTTIASLAITKQIHKFYMLEQAKASLSKQ